MDQRESRNFRLYILGALLVAVLLVYLFILYSVQVVHHQDYATQSVRSIARPETVKASRGVITDRNGRLLVGNRSTYNLTFDPSLLKEDEDQNEAILRLIGLCQEQGVDWIENLPVSRRLPYTYTLDELRDPVLKRRFLSYLKALDPSREALKEYLLQHPETVAPQDEDDPSLPELPEVQGELTPEQEAQRRDQLGEELLDLLAAKHLTARLLIDAGITPQTLLEWMREDFDLSPSLSLAEARLVLGIQYELYLRRLGTTVPYILAEDIDMTFISLINDGGYAGAKVTSAYAREIQTSAAAHILGMVTPIYAEDDMEALRAKGYSGDEIIGRSGAEAAFEDYLRGTDGRRVVSVDSGGKITGEYYTQDPKPGNNVELTIDLKLQQAAEETLAATVTAMNERDGSTTRGAGLAVVKVGTGEVLALVSYPTYDLAAYIEDGTYRAQLNTDESTPLVNRATMGRYSPGSTYKPMMAVAALEEGVVTLNEKILDTGRWYYPETVAGTGPWSWRCWNWGGHGRLNITQAITASCNFFFAEMGYQLGLDRLNEYAAAFGLGGHRDHRRVRRGLRLRQEHRHRDRRRRGPFGRARGTGGPGRGLVRRRHDPGLHRPVRQPLHPPPDRQLHGHPGLRRQALQRPPAEIRQDLRQLPGGGRGRPGAHQHRRHQRQHPERREDRDAQPDQDHPGPLLQQLRGGGRCQDRHHPAGRRHHQQRLLRVLRPLR